MTCDKCKGDGESILICVESALEILRTHFQMQLSLSLEQTTLIRSLKQRNDKLNDAITLLQQRSTEVHLDKRRKLGGSPKKLDSPKLSESISPLGQTQDSLNMNIALTTQNDEDDEDEIIGESERLPTGSPCRKLHSVRRKLLKRESENMQPSDANLTTSWLGKTPKAQRPLLFTKTAKNSQPQATKLKQMRLEFNRSRCDKEQDVVEASPSWYAKSLKQAKESRSFLHRTNKNVSTSTSEDRKKPISSEPTFDSDDELFFDFNSPEKQGVSEAPLPANDTLQIPSSNTSSVVLLTPATQDIIFVDDSSDDGRQLNTLDMIDSVTQLKVHEAKRIDMQKQQCQKRNVSVNRIEEQVTPPRIKEEPQTCNDMGNETTKLPEDIENLLDGEEEDTLEEFPRPIAIKRELTLKERYNIDCAQCEKFLNIMCAKLTEQEIKNHLKNCTHRIERAMRPESPEGFWNPLMVSFSANDPRNEVIIDNRFAGKRRQQ
ncbi:uncharacterized protein LOC115625633 [Scaptodrosophila lebanonensis]|uniref:Uncharacterized protein LOC115625633 n=1 Tax=Drosophila lebanonensis TaxID=7225 RepID=A0A6J2TM83_DROLE|nr:uncharacterized protein LOC115625633 [Scaptodrosophila lebanonensis]